MAKKRYVLVGTGIRSNFFISPLVVDYRNEAELAALCDLSPTRLAYYNARLAGELGYHAVPTYAADQFDRMLDEQRPDCVIVTSKDSTHHDFIVRSLRHGCDVVTEKPMTIDAAKCRLVLDTVAQTRRHVRVAFNYRWSAHRTRVKELLMADTIGAIKSVNVEYLLNTAHGADYYRRWHAHMAESGGLLVHKSTHHFDLVNWWTDAIPEQVFAYGRLDFYGRANAAARGDEARTRYARYTDQPASNGDPFQLSLHSDKDLEALYFKAERDDGYLRDRNVFRDDIDIYDNMTALVRYRTGVFLTYSLLSFSPREGMRISLNGERGRLEYRELQPTHILSDAEPAERNAADRETETIRVFPHFKPSYEVPVTALPGNHNGSDPVLAEQIFSASAPVDPFHRAAGHEQGAASILIGVAANESIATNRPVNITDLAPLKPGAKKLSELI
ncbi:MAG TPA: Gfo/Idh/MocA family oxidoreductase [Opitutus sp.]|nr:Gfo/Idh/MocA family oxidoreductase [Opitutus sp.]